MTASSSAERDLGRVGGVSDLYRYYVLAVLLAANTFSVLDRMVLAVLQESIKLDLGLSDSQLGFLSGVCFAAFYAVFGIPVARLADRHNRTRIIAISLFVWSVMTALSGAARNFIMLLVFRIGLAVGEAGCTPPAHSLIADYFPKERRGTALAIFSLGGPLGVVLGLAVGGWLNELVGWRMAFVLAGAPALVVAILALFTLREPPRGHLDGLAGQALVQPPLGQMLRTFWASAPFRNLAMGYAVLSIVSSAALSWSAPFYIRVHGLGSAQIGMWLAMVYAVPLAIGTVIGGVLGDRLARRDVRWRLWLPGVMALIALPCALAQYNVAIPEVSLLLSIAPALAFGMYIAPSFAVAQMLVPLSLRASASAILLLVVSLTGVALGPVVVGVLSDLFQAQGRGDGSLSLALTLVSLAILPAAVLHLVAGQGLRKALSGETPTLAK